MPGAKLRTSPLRRSYIKQGKYVYQDIFVVFYPCVRIKRRLTRPKTGVSKTKRLTVESPLPGKAGKDNRTCGRCACGNLLCRAVKPPAFSCLVFRLNELIGRRGF